MSNMTDNNDTGSNLFFKVTTTAAGLAIAVFLLAVMSESVRGYLI